MCQVQNDLTGDAGAESDGVDEDDVSDVDDGESGEESEGKAT
jgi:hypothetical protein